MSAKFPRLKESKRNDKDFVEVAIYLARDMSGISCKELGDYFGGVSGALITIMHKRVSEEAAKNRLFNRRLDKVKKRIFNM